MIHYTCFTVFLNLIMSVDFFMFEVWNRAVSWIYTSCTRLSTQSQMYSFTKLSTIVSPTYASFTKLVKRCLEFTLRLQNCRYKLKYTSFTKFYETCLCFVLWHMVQGCLDLQTQKIESIKFSPNYQVSTANRIQTNLWMYVC